MSSQLKVKEILFPEGEVKTDAMLYKEKSSLLVPEPFSQNIFYSISDELQTRFFIGSDSHANLDRLQSFFTRLYGATFEDSAIKQVEEGFSISLRLKTPLFTEKEFYYPGFVRNILDFNSIDRSSVIRYSVSIMAGEKRLLRPKAYGLSITLTFDSELHKSRLAPLIDQETMKLSKETGIRGKIKKSLKVRDTGFKNTFNLINFVRVPSEKDVVI